VPHVSIADISLFVELLISALWVSVIPFNLFCVCLLFPVGHKSQREELDSILFIFEVRNVDKHLMAI